MSLIQKIENSIIVELESDFTNSLDFNTLSDLSIQIRPEFQDIRINENEFCIIIHFLVNHKKSDEFHLLKKLTLWISKKTKLYFIAGIDEIHYSNKTDNLSPYPVICVHPDGTYRFKIVEDHFGSVLKDYKLVPYSLLIQPYLRNKSITYGEVLFDINDLNKYRRKLSKHYHYNDWTESEI